jgi:AraC-like DNA-binding protein
VTRVSALAFGVGPPGLTHARAVAEHFDPHLHSTFSVVVVKDGAAAIRSDRWAATVQAGDVFFLNPFEVHSGKSTTSGTRYETFYLTGSFVARCLGVKTERLSIETPWLHTAATQRLVAALEHPAAVQDALGEVLRACRYTLTTEDTNAIVRDARARIASTPAGAVRTQDLAHAVGTHKSHLIRTFKAAVGLPPQTYVRQLRVARARELICAGMELGEVAQAVGFSDQSHLSREFKKVFGVPPGTLARSVRDGTIAG